MDGTEAVAEEAKGTEEKAQKPKAKRGRPKGSKNGKRTKKFQPLMGRNGNGLTNREARAFFKAKIKHLKSDLKIAEAGLLILSKLS